MSWQELLYWLVKAFRLLVFISCFGTLTWQLSKCCMRFLEKPQGTRVSVISSAGKMFPSITVCPDMHSNTSVLNSTFLSNCGIDSSEYRYQSKWSVQGIEKCEDPKTLFHSIIFKPEHLVKEIEIDDKQTIFPNDTASFLPIDMENYG